MDCRRRRRREELTSLATRGRFPRHTHSVTSYRGTIHSVCHPHKRTAGLMVMDLSYSKGNRFLKFAI